jgi:EmrB/QacA subfamily drug resistance transporter
MEAHAAPLSDGFHNLAPRQLRLTVAGLLLAMFVSALDQMVVGPAMPRIIAELQGFDKYAWVTTAYMLTSTLGVPVFGKLSDIYGRKYFYVAGVLIFLVGSWLCGFARDMNELIGFRAIQGIGAGINEGLAFAIIGDVFPPAKRGKVQGIFGAVFGLASIVGPTLGGWLTDNVSWRAIFYVNVPVGLAALAMLWFYFPYFRPDASIKRRIDWLGVAALLGAATPLLLALSSGGHDCAWGGSCAWGSATVNGLFVLSGVCLAAFIAVETWQARGGGEPVLPLELFQQPIYTVGVLTTLIIGFGMFGTILYIPLFVQGVLQTNATDSGKVLWPMMFGMLTASISTGQLIQRTGRYKIFGVVGLALVSVGLYLCSRMTVETGYWSGAARNMVVVGFGMGMTFPVFSLAVQNAVPYRVMGIAMSSLQFFRTLGGMMGTAVFGAILTNGFQPEFEQQAAPALQSIQRAVQGLPAQALAQLPAPAQQALQNPAAMFANPEILLSPEAMKQMGANFGRLPGGDQILSQLLLAMRGSLAGALSHVFFIGSIVLVGGFVVSLFLGERPLRKSNLEGWEGGHGAVATSTPARASIAAEAEGEAAIPVGAERGVGQAREVEPDRERELEPVAGD